MAKEVAQTVGGKQIAWLIAILAAFAVFASLGNEFKTHASASAHDQVVVTGITAVSDLNRSTLPVLTAGIVASTQSAIPADIVAFDSQADTAAVNAATDVSVNIPTAFGHTSTIELANSRQGSATPWTLLAGSSQDFLQGTNAISEFSDAVDNSVNSEDYSNRDDLANNIVHKSQATSERNTFISLSAFAVLAAAFAIVAKRTLRAFTSAAIRPSSTTGGQGTSRQSSFPWSLRE